MATHKKLTPRHELGGEPVYRVQEVARFFSVSPETIRNWIKDGRLKAYALPKFYFIPKSSFDAFLRSVRGNI